MAAKRFTVEVNPAVLRWARESGGYTSAQVADSIQVPEKSVVGWESGEPHPTWSELTKLARLYKRPVASLLLPDPPKEAPLPTDFRRLPDSNRGLSPKTRWVIRTARWLVRRGSELERDLGIERVFQGPRVSPSDYPEQAAQEFRARLGVEIEEQVAWRTVGMALRRWRGAVEAQHVFVFQFGMPIEEVRGFSLLEEHRPAIVLNQADAVAARVFTLFHELAHLVIGQPGVCMPDEAGTGESQQVETFCNRFAAALLIPRTDLEQRLPSSPADEEINHLARRYRVSRYVVLGRMHALGAISRGLYQRIVERWESRAETPVPPPAKRKGGQDRAARCLAERGRRFVSLVLEADRRDYLPASDATSYLGIDLRDLERLASKVK